jgi:hypothetical protein
MNNNKKGLSTIVATLLIILLTLVAVGIIWVVVRNVVQGGSQQVSIDTKCLNANVVATRVTNDTTNFSVTLSRQAGDDVLGGVKLVFTNDAGTSSFVKDVPGDITALSTVTTYVTILDTDLSNPSKVGVVSYFLDESGNEQLCQTSNPLEF